MNSARICLSLYGTTDEICTFLRSYDADLFEIRLDLCSDPDGRAIREATSKPLLFTAHGQPQLLERFWPFADYVDVEQRYAGGSNTILSIHAGQEDPEKLWERFSGEHMTKIVLETNDYDAIARLIELNRVHSPLALCFASGEVGAFSRVLSVLSGARWIYASIAGRETGPGQFSYEQLVETFRLRRFDVSSHFSAFGIIGDPVSHSLSPEAHNQKFEEAELPWIYLPFPCKDLQSLLAHAPRWNSAGFSITHPFKEAVIPMLDSVTPEVATVQSCNTIAFVDGRWIGTNTDVDGIRALLQDVPLHGKRVVLVGAGATAKAFASILRPDVAELLILNRTLEKARDLAVQFQARSGALQDLGDADYDVLIQTTPVGWESAEFPLNPDHLRRGKTVIDAIYKDTALLQKARELGCRTINGRLWFDTQADAQFRWWRKVLNVAATGPY